MDHLIAGFAVILAALITKYPHSTTISSIKSALENHTRILRSDAISLVYMANQYSYTARFDPAANKDIDGRTTQMLITDWNIQFPDDSNMD